MLRAWQEIAPDLPALPAAALGDPYQYRLAALQGFTGLPDLLSRAELDRAIAAGELALFRGVSEPAHAEQLRGGAYRAGYGDEGSGMYAAYGPLGRITAEEYAELDGGSQPVIVRMTLKTGADIREFAKVEEAMAEASHALIERRRQVSEVRERERLQQLRLAYCSDVACFATTQGIDALDVSRRNFVIILNRTALRVEQDERRL